MTFRRVRLIEVEYVEGNEDVDSSPRGWGEASTGSVRVERIDEDTFELTFPPEVFGYKVRVDVEAVRAVLKLGVS